VKERYVFFHTVQEVRKYMARYMDQSLGGRTFFEQGTAVGKARNPRVRVKLVVVTNNCTLFVIIHNIIYTQHYFYLLGIIFTY